MTGITDYVSATTDAVSNLLTAPADPVAGADVTRQLRMTALIVWIGAISLGHYNESKGRSLGYGPVKIW